jgi:glutamate-ammonia-ligase adenylyltransferase
MIETRLKDAASITPDPERSLKNLQSFIAENPSKTEDLEPYLKAVSLLFSYSQFLANYAIAYPDHLFEILGTRDVSRDRKTLSLSLKETLDGTRESPLLHTSPRGSIDLYMSAIRKFKIHQLLRITVRDILQKVDLVETMLELSILADVIIDGSVQIIRDSFRETYGSPAGDSFSVISLGKLGGEELNFSSDVDLMFVYGPEQGETSGITKDTGVTVNRISTHEYYCKIGEAVTRFLSLNTDAGFAYRVDLRLRPEGQRGAIALSLRSYELYYESWGRAWERAMLLRARPAAGDSALGTDFLEMISPFVYRKYLDFSSIDEIRSLKSRIDSTFKKGNIKRGYGGIREIEFFAQALQLIYAGREPLLRERSLLKVLHRLFQKALIGNEDFSLLSENYRFLRMLEHRLQQVNDIQTHTLPSDQPSLDVIAKKMGFDNRIVFLSDLEKRRRTVRTIYDSLFADQEKDIPVSDTFFDEEFSERELQDYLSDMGLKNINRAARNISAIKDSMYSFQTIRGRKLLQNILPVFVDASLKSGSPDMALNHLQSFAQFLSTRESYIERFSESRELIDMLTSVFSQSEYLSKIIMSRPEYLEMIGFQDISGKSLRVTKAEIQSMLREGSSAIAAIRLMKQMEEMRVGLLFLRKKIGVLHITKALSKTAEAIVSVCLEQLLGNSNDLAVIGLGKLGGRELSFNADLDVVFVSPNDMSAETTKTAEKLLRMLISYTKEGIAYRVDTRLRPEGSKGPLVTSLASFETYYEKAAASWELQALLKARPVAGALRAGYAFMHLAEDTLRSRAHEISASGIKHMRERIVKELSKEPEGYDIKLGPGGIEEIEFTVQYLQLNNCNRNRKLLVQGTLDAIYRLKHAGIVNRNDAEILKENYLFYRKLEAFLRLRGEQILKKDADVLQTAAKFMNFQDSDTFGNDMLYKRQRTEEISSRYLRDT